MFACVQYTEDKERAVLPVSLMKDFSPRNAQDFRKDTIVLAYWVDEDGHGENFYPANVTALADSLEGLVGKLKASRSTFPRVIMGKLGKGIVFDDSESESSPETALVVPPNEERIRAYEDQIKDLEMEVGQLKQEIEKKEGRNRELVELLDQERERSRRLTDALLNKFELACPTGRAAETQGKVADLLIPAVASDPSQPYEVHLRHGMSMPDNKFNFILKSGHEMKVARDMARFFWSATQMKERCLTGQPNRRAPDSVPKKQATPAKVQAIMNTVENVIAESTSDAAAGKRLGNARKALRDLFAEMARLGQRSKCPSSP
ncbi:hypothetical protein MTO96_039516 [Rhipicephalus appendiculatus]